MHQLVNGVGRLFGSSPFGKREEGIAGSWRGFPVGRPTRIILPEHLHRQQQLEVEVGAVGHIFQHAANSKIALVNFQGLSDEFLVAVAVVGPEQAVGQRAGEHHLVGPLKHRGVVTRQGRVGKGAQKVLVGVHRMVGLEALLVSGGTEAFDHGVVAGVYLRGVGYGRQLVAQGLGHREGNGSVVVGSVGALRLAHHPVHTVGLRLEVIISVLMLHDHVDHQAAGNAHRQADHVHAGGGAVAQQVAVGGGEVVF